MDTTQLNKTNENVHFIYDNYGNIIDKVIVENTEKMVQTFELEDYSNELYTPLYVEDVSLGTGNATGKADIVFVIDTTGSMGSAIKEVKDNINIFAEKMVNDYNIDANFSLIEYRDITSDGINSTIQHMSTSSKWFTNVNSFKKEVNSLKVSGGGDYPETPFDGLMMAGNIDWRNGATKFVVLITDASYKTNNNYGIKNLQEVANFYNRNGIIASVIAPRKSMYDELTTTTTGLFGSLYTDFNTILIELANKVGEITNKDGEWIFLDDFLAIKLSDKLENADVNDTDGDGLTDAEELETSKVINLYPYIEFLTNRHEVPVKYYIGKTKITVWSYKSNPTLLDTDYDGISDGPLDYDGSTVTLDIAPKNNKFKGTLYFEYDEEMKKSNQSMPFTIDYRLFFDSNFKYNKNLAMMSSIFAADIYQDSYIIIDEGAIGGSDNTKELAEIFGLKDVEDVHINGEAYDYDKYDSTEFLIGHRTVEYRGDKKEIILLVVRGTNGTISEWSSNFDVGADSPEYYKANGSEHPHWLNKENHKGFDVAKNRILDEFDKYMAKYQYKMANDKVILITGHSRGAAIANLLGAEFENSEKSYDEDFIPFTYTFAALNSTTDNDTSKYKTIFNIINTDDIIPFLPLKEWGFTKYGIIKEISVEECYENKFGPKQKGTFEWLVNKDYDNDSGTNRTLYIFSLLAKTREDIYVLDDSFDGKASSPYGIFWSLSDAEKTLEIFTKELEEENLLFIFYQLIRHSTR